LTPAGDIPRLYNYAGDKYHVDEVLGQFDKDKKGDIMMLQ
jgi:hypothetical protein